MSRFDPTTFNFKIRRLKERDAEDLVACFERCYGRTYPSEDFYSAERLRRRITNRTLRSVVALDQNGRLIGHTGLRVREPEHGIPTPMAAVAGNTVIDPDFRGRGVLGPLLAALVDLTTSEGFVGYVHYPTTAHTIIQERSVKRDGVETGILLAYVPAETDYREIEQGSGRLAATVVYQPFSAAPKREVYLPRRYRDLLEALYLQAALERRAISPDDQASSKTELTLEPDYPMGVLHVNVRRSGTDLAERVDAALEARTFPVAQVDLVLDDPGVDGAVETLRAQGFFYCGLLPELAHTDVLRMQRLQVETVPGGDPFEVNLANPGAKKLLEGIRRELAEIRNS